MEVVLLVSLLRETGADFAIFEPVEDAFMSEKGERRLEAMCAERGKGVGLHLGEREEASVAVGKGTKTGFGGAIGGSSACAGG
jgi:hypothetical protein